MGRCLLVGLGLGPQAQPFLVSLILPFFISIPIVFAGLWWLWILLFLPIWAIPPQVFSGPTIETGSYLSPGSSPLTGSASRCALQRVSTDPLTTNSGPVIVLGLCHLPLNRLAD